MRRFHPFAFRHFGAVSAISAMALGVVVTALAFGARIAESPKHTVALAEQYTSEGCDSCPPADKWLSGIAARGLTVDKVVPLSLHIDCWDYIGWKDVFAQPKCAERQRELAQVANSRLVYTHG